VAAVLFREKQRFRLGARGIALAMPPAALLFLCLRQLVWHHPWGNPPMSNGGMVFLTVLVWLVYLRLMAVHLRTELRPDRLSVAMKGLFRRSRIPVAEIVKAEPVEYDAIAEYGGYGIRDGPLGKAYIASGSRAVHLQLSDGREFLIGSQRADELARSINQAQSARGR
jgi:hypothetical protein